MSSSLFAPVSSERDGRDWIAPLLKKKAVLAAAFILSGVAGVAISFAIKPTYTARLSFVSPQPQASAAVSALASLSSLSSLAGASMGLKNPSDQYISLMQSTTVSDRIIDRFKLMEVYDYEYRVDARKKLAREVKLVAGKKDSIITVEVDDTSKERSADMANAYLDELGRLVNSLVLTEAKQRRVFFEQQLEQTRARLTQAQLALQSSGFSAGALKAEPKAAAETYAQANARAAAIEVRLQAMRRTLTDQSPEVQRELAALATLRSQIQAMEKPLDRGSSEDYVGAYRDFKYQEAVMEIYSRQFEIAKLDESREGAFFQIIDKATPPEKKSKPSRSVIAILAALLGFAGTAGFLIHKNRKSAGVA